MEAIEYVSETTHIGDIRGLRGFYEQGGIYPGDQGAFAQRDGIHGRLLRAGEHVITCPFCEQRFANTRDMTAEACLDLHVVGDEDCPSICGEPICPPED